jgi:hypothetical protein
MTFAVDKVNVNGKQLVKAKKMPLARLRVEFWMMDFEFSVIARNEAISVMKCKSSLEIASLRSQ